MVSTALSFNVVDPVQRYDIQLAQAHTLYQLDIVENYDPYEVQKTVCGHLDTLPRLLLSIHRESSKSTMAESFCFRKLAGNEPQLIVYFSINEDSAKAHLKAVKMKFEARKWKDGRPNPYRQLLPKRSKSANYEWGAMGLTLSNGNRMIIGTIGKGVLGLKEGDLRPTLIIIDDPVDPKKSGEDKNTISWLKQTITPLGGPFTQIIIIGTPRRFLDLIMHVVNDKDSLYTVYNFPVVSTDKDGIDHVLIPEFWKRRGICCKQKIFYCYGLGGHALETAHKKAFEARLYRGTELHDLFGMATPDDPVWQEKYDCCESLPKYRCWYMEDDSDELMWQHLKQKRFEVGSIGWVTEYMCRPADDGSTLFPLPLLEPCIEQNWSFESSRKWAAAINAAYVKGGEVPDRIHCVIGCDLAIGTSEGSSYVVYTVLQVKPEIRILDVYRKQGVTYKEQKRQLLKLYKLYRPAMIYIESNYYQAVFPQELQEEYAMLPVYQFNTGGDKNKYQIGVPSLKDYFETLQMKVPNACHDSFKYQNVLFEELQGMVYEEGKVKKTREFDDTVMSLWIAIQAGKEYYGSILQAY